MEEKIKDKGVAKESQERKYKCGNSKNGSIQVVSDIKWKKTRGEIDEYSIEESGRVSYRLKGISVVENMELHE